MPDGTMNDACPRVRSSGSTTAVTTCTSAIPPLVAQVLVPLSSHSSFASSYVARVRIAPTSEPASGSEEQNAAILRSPGVPNICGAHSPICSGVPLAASDGGGQRGADDGEADAGVAPEQLLHGDRQPEPGLVEALGGEEVERVEADLRGLLDHRPGELLALVPLGRRRADHVLGERVHPLLQLDVVGPEVEARRGRLVAHAVDVTDGSPGRAAWVEEVAQRPSRNLVRRCARRMRVPTLRRFRVTLAAQRLNQRCLSAE